MADVGLSYRQPADCPITNNFCPDPEKERWQKIRTIDNFVNILRAPFLYISLLHSFSIVTVWLLNFLAQKYWGKSYPLNDDEIDKRIDDNLGFLYLSKLFSLSFFFSFFFLQKNEERNGFCFSIS